MYVLSLTVMINKDVANCCYKNGTYICRKPKNDKQKTRTQFKHEKTYIELEMKSVFAFNL